MEEDSQIATSFKNQLHKEGCLPLDLSTRRQEEVWEANIHVAELHCLTWVILTSSSIN